MDGQQPVLPGLLHVHERKVTRASHAWRNYYERIGATVMKYYMAGAHATNLILTNPTYQLNPGVFSHFGLGGQ